MVATFDEYLPKSEQMLVGSEHVLKVQELVAMKRDQVFNVVFGDIDIVGAITAFTQLADEETKDEAAKGLAATAQNILGGSLTQIAQIVLSTDENMKKVGIKGSFNDFKKWVAANLTMKQEARLLELVFEVNDFAGLVKNYITLAGKIQPAGEVIEKTEAVLAPTSA